MKHASGILDYVWEYVIGYLEKYYFYIIKSNHPAAAMRSPSKKPEKIWMFYQKMLAKRIHTLYTPR